MALHPQGRQPLLMQATRCRLATPDDASEIAALVNRAYRPAAHERGWTHEADLVAGARTSPQQVRALFGPQSCVLLLCQARELEWQAAAQILACVHLDIDGSTAHIGMLATRPDAQAQGLGKQMLAHAEQHAMEHFGVSEFEISVLSARNELLSFYARRGYLRTGVRTPYPLDSGVGQPLLAAITLETLRKTA
jgi:ribosomal protein S18 acetylase RimI-like enzyme